MAPITRRSAGSSQQANAVAPGAPTTTSPVAHHGKTTHVSTTKSDAKATTSKKRKAVVKSEKPAKKVLYYRESYGKAPSLPVLSADAVETYTDLEEQSDTELWMQKEKTTVAPVQPVFPIQLNDGTGSSTVINLNLADVLAKAGLTLAPLAPVMSLPIHSQANDNMGNCTGVLFQNTLQVANNGGVSVTGQIPTPAASLLTIPQELRDKIYRLLLVRDQPVDFGRRDGFSRSATFLRTCKAIHDEGTTVLYGQNSFHFTRDTSVRGKYYEARWQEVAYQDIRRFLESIGPENISKLKYVSFLLIDNMVQDLTAVPFPKFTQDPHLQHVFRLLGKHAIFEKFGVMFSGRSMVYCFDYHFLSALSEIKCHKLDFIRRRNGYNNKLAASLEPKLEKLMVIKREDADGVIEEKKRAPKMVYKERETIKLVYAK